MAKEVIGNGKNPKDSVKSLTEEFGFERTAWLTALNIAAHPLDGRFYQSDKEWACKVLEPHFEVKPDELFRQNSEKSKKFDRLINGGELYSIHNTHLAQFAEVLIPEYEKYLEKTVTAEKTSEQKTPDNTKKNQQNVSNSAEEPKLKSIVIDLSGEQSKEKTAEIEGTKEKSDNFTITDENLGEGGLKTKFQNNISAIETLQKIESENRPATNEEKETLSKYVGWGGMQQALLNKPLGNPNTFNQAVLCSPYQ